jgi:hypothetical protein
MILIMQRTLEYLNELSKDKTISLEQVNMLNRIWDGVSLDNMRTTDCGIKYVKK